RSCSSMCRLAKALVFLTALLAFTASSPAQKNSKPTSGMTLLEKRASLNMDAARANPLQLRNLRLKMPKGADLHNHLYGAVYAETWIRNAAEDRLCIDPAAIRGTTAVLSPSEGQQTPSCGTGKVPAADAFA